MLYDTSIEETRCWKKKRTKNKMNEREREKNVRSTVHRSLPVQDEVSSSGCESELLSTANPKYYPCLPPEAFPARRHVISLSPEATRGNFSFLAWRKHGSTGMIDVIQSIAKK